MRGTTIKISIPSIREKIAPQLMGYGKNSLSVCGSSDRLVGCNAQMGLREVFDGEAKLEV